MPHTLHLRQNVQAKKPTRRNDDAYRRATTIDSYLLMGNASRRASSIKYSISRWVVYHHWKQIAKLYQSPAVVMPLRSRCEILSKKNSQRSPDIKFRWDKRWEAVRTALFLRLHLAPLRVFLGCCCCGDTHITMMPCHTHLLIRPFSQLPASRKK